jgi:hypothetical protein
VLSGNFKALDVQAAESNPRARGGQHTSWTETPCFLCEIFLLPRWLGGVYNDARAVAGIRGPLMLSCPCPGSLNRLIALSGFVSSGMDRSMCFAPEGPCWLSMQAGPC